MVHCSQMPFNLHCRKTTKISSSSSSPGLIGPSDCKGLRSSPALAPRRRLLEDILAYGVSLPSMTPSLIECLQLRHSVWRYGSESCKLSPVGSTCL